MPTNPILKRKSAEAMIPGGLDFVLWNGTPSPWKEPNPCLLP